MKTKKIVTDERIRQEENQVFAWVGRAMNILLPLSFLLKSLVLKWSFDTYVFELVAMLVISAYIIFGYWKKGLYSLKIKRIRCQLVLVNASSTFAFVS